MKEIESIILELARAAKEAEPIELTFNDDRASVVYNEELKINQAYPDGKKKSVKLNSTRSVRKFGM